MNWTSQTGMKETFPLNAICGDLRSFFLRQSAGNHWTFRKKTP